MHGVDGPQEFKKPEEEPEYEEYRYILSSFSACKGKEQ